MGGGVSENAQCPHAEQSVKNTNCNSNMDTPMDLLLRIHQNVTRVLALIRVLHIRQLQCAVVLKGTLAMVKWE
ncbi:hypothetical protein AMELA_G00217910 [Ameiurus melas]|uniref:Uncharacterized protein n=1 Tax=Ameiurus melas TaxID=219545 RepID=A0A7J6A1K6_AMEME|nr:hypothetical protein AMELA_G00217910 [Ameiurus melas]